jgi:ribosomal protein S18 acetylase RimI-like enzyme
MTVSIVPIAEEHIESFHAALSYVVGEKKYLAFLDPPPIDGTRKFILENIEKGHAQFVVLSDNKVVGWCDIIPSSRQVSAHCGSLGMGLLPEFRGQGIGKRLMQISIDKAHKNGLTRIELTVREHNANAIALYKKIGFVMEGTKKKANLVDGVYEDIHMMALLS